MASARKASIGFIFVTLFLDILGIGLLIPIVPQVVRGFAERALAGEGDALMLALLRPGESPTEVASRWYGWLIASYAAMQFVFSPVIGSLSDRFGRRPVLLASNACQGLDYLLMAFAPSLGWLFVGRLVAGLTGASIGTATAYIADVTPPERRAQSFALVGIAFGMGFVVGPLLGGVLGAVMVRLPFLVAAVLTLANAAWGFFVLPESLPTTLRRPFSWRRANPLGTLAGLGRSPLVLAMTATAFLFNLGQRALESTWVLSTAHRYGWTSRDAGVSLAVVGVAAAVVQGGLVRRIVPALGERRAFLAGGLVGVLAFVGYGLSPSGLVTFCIIPLGALGGVAGPALQALLSRAVPADEQGLLQGGLMSLTSLTQIIGPPVATGLFGTFISSRAPLQLPGVPFFFGAACMLAGLAFALRAFARFPETKRAA
ncbi:MAG: TCR/Tet family MFS transporter [Myxococcaceae bacterium]|jgi:DHA1 family tetracycline resistance protein-like MFS transporter|nr:TCR/Tet family MFS transporter [Myxococcaceae bacterium]MCA3014826.1 TCR/Tet family MFS transporter [Myxococcaceae bacterium]